MKNFMLCILNVVLLVCGQMLFKLAVDGKKISSLPDILKLILSPYMMAAVALYAGTTLLWVYILTKMPISYAYPIQILTLPLIVILSLFFFHEVIPAHRWIGIGIIVLGVLVVSR